MGSISEVAERVRTALAGARARETAEDVRSDGLQNGTGIG
mgnify:CR=1 FL=1